MRPSNHDVSSISYLCSIVKPVESQRESPSANLLDDHFVRKTNRWHANGSPINHDNRVLLQVAYPKNCDGEYIMITIIGHY